MGHKITVFAILSLSAVAGTAPGPNVGEIVQKSAQVTGADRIAGANYDFKETDREQDGSSKTYAVEMLFGSPYNELIAVDGKPLPRDKQVEEKHKLAREIERRKQESPEDRQHRLAGYQKEEHRDLRFMEEFVRAFDFNLIGQTRLNHHSVYVIQATPRAGYQPTDNPSKVLTGMRGELWIDKQTFQWVKVKADVIHPVSIEGFLAKVEPGTHFELEKLPVGNGIWLPRHFTMTAKAKVLSVINHGDYADETYFDYQNVSPQSVAR